MRSIIVNRLFQVEGYEEVTEVYGRPMYLVLKGKKWFLVHQNGIPLSSSELATINAEWDVHANGVIIQTDNEFWHLGPKGKQLLFMGSWADWEVYGDKLSIKSS